VNTRLELAGLDQLPLWGKVLLASRIARRAALWMPNSASDHVRARYVEACDAIDRCAYLGARPQPDLAAIEHAKLHQPSAAERGAAFALYFAADSAHAAESAQDFGAADAACHNSMLKACDAAKAAPGLNPIQVHLFIATDADLIGFACKEHGVGKYQGLGSQVAQRLYPVHPPDLRDDDIKADDPTFGAR